MQDASGSAYALGHSEREIGRLTVQARVLEPFTRRMLERAGISKGMRVLDVGTGAGDVAFLCASLVGPEGRVTGVDIGPQAVATAQDRARRAGMENVEFVTADPCKAAWEEPFDAVVGRLVLMHQQDPVATLGKLARLLVPGGILAFQEFDLEGATTFPEVEIFSQCLRWIRAAFTVAGAHDRMGIRLYSTFVSAGIAAPELSLDAGIWGGAGNPAAHLVRDVVRSLLPVLVQHGITTEAEIGIETLQERLEQAIAECNAVAIAPSLIGAWTRL